MPHDDEMIPARRSQRGDREGATQESRYKVITVDLTAARTDPFRLKQIGLPIANVAVIGLPAPAVGLVSIRIGDTGDFIPLNQQGMEFRPKLAERGGLYVLNSAIAQTLTLFVSFEEAPVYVSI